MAALWIPSFGDIQVLFCASFVVFPEVNVRVCVSSVLLRFCSPLFRLDWVRCLFCHLSLSVFSFERICEVVRKCKRAVSQLILKRVSADKTDYKNQCVSERRVYPNVFSHRSSCRPFFTEIIQNFITKTLTSSVWTSCLSNKKKHYGKRCLKT